MANTDYGNRGDGQEHWGYSIALVILLLVLFLLTYFAKGPLLCSNYSATGSGSGSPDPSGCCFKVQAEKVVFEPWMKLAQSDEQTLFVTDSYTGPAVLSSTVTLVTEGLDQDMTFTIIVSGPSGLIHSSYHVQGGIPNIASRCEFNLAEIAIEEQGPIKVTIVNHHPKTIMVTETEYFMKTFEGGYPS